MHSIKHVMISAVALMTPNYTAATYVCNAPIRLRGQIPCLRPTAIALQTWPRRQLQY